MKPTTTLLAPQRCLSEPGALIHNNPAENCIRPLKLGAKNWQHLRATGVCHVVGMTRGARYSLQRDFTRN